MILKIALLLLKENKRLVLSYFIFFVIFYLIEILTFSIILSKIIVGLKNNTFKFDFLKILIGLSIIYVFLNYLKKYYEYKILATYSQQSRIKLLNILFKANNFYFINTDYEKFVPSINRVAGPIGLFFKEILISIIPYIIFIIIISIFLLVNYDFKIALFFFIINLIILIFLYKSFPKMIQLNKLYETNAQKVESNLIENCNNMDKIVYRGKTNQIYNKMKDLVNDTQSKLISFNNNVIAKSSLAKFFQDVIIFPLCIFWVIYKKYDVPKIIILITLLGLYRARGESVFSFLNLLFETIGRKNKVEKHFKVFMSNYEKINQNNLFVDTLNNKFTIIQFKNLSFRYDSKKPLLENINLNIDFNKTKIVGLYGTSGFGKSTLARLLIKLYKPDSGSILINNQDIKSIDSEFLKKKIIYINQEQKLFNSTIKDNLLFGCEDVRCLDEVNNLLKHSNIWRSFNKKDLLNYKTGSSGNNLSGGQRQIINVLNGLITPSDLLILDEPTSSLDHKYKFDLINIINEYKHKKKGIIIITHDQSIKHIFNRVINIRDINNK